MRACCAAISPSLAIRAHGFSMVELLCSVAISLLLLAGVVATLSSSHASYRNAERTSRVEETGWRALEILTRDIRAAGFAGCTRNPHFEASSLRDAAELPWNFLDSAVRGYQSKASHWIPAIRSDYVPGAAPDSDVLVVRVPKRGAEPTKLRVDMVTPEDALTIEGDKTSLQANDVALIYDCNARAYFHVTSFLDGVIDHRAETGAKLPGNSDDSLGYAFAAGAEIIPVQTIAYYIRSESPGAADRSLWRRVGLDRPERLFEGIEQMQLQFGIDATGDSQIDKYVTADLVPNWNQVYSVRVAMLVRSKDETEYGPASYRLLDVDVPRTDAHYRQAFAATASIRNRAQGD